MYPVIDLGDAPQESLEQLGTKPKFWITIEEHGHCICKLTRADTGEDWSEVVAASVAGLLGLPHAAYTLALYGGHRAVITPSFVPGNGVLMLGNQILITIDPTYDVGAARFRQRAHTVDLVMEALSGVDDLEFPPSWECPNDISAPHELFVGYLALDALIGNTDRHHENWGIVVTFEESGGMLLSLAPTFDHASCLGCHETDQAKARRLQSRDLNDTPAAFAMRARSAFFRNVSDSRPMSPIDAFGAAAVRWPEAGRYWTQVLSSVSQADLGILLKDVPADRISETSRRFALELMAANLRRVTEMTS